MRSAGLVLGLMVFAVPLKAQDSGAVRVRLGLQEGAEPGRQAPAVVLPYVTAEGHGPADQPFDLAKELGHPVVLVFYPAGNGTLVRQEWTTLAARWRAAADSGLVVAGVSSDNLTAQARLAAELRLPFKLLSDTSRAVERQFGAALPPGGSFAVVVVGWDGRVVYRDFRFRPSERAGSLHLEAAIRAARKRS